MEECVETKKKKFYKNPDNYPFNCPCGRNYSVEKNFKAHRRRVHGDGCTVPIKNKDCPLCPYQSPSLQEILVHFEAEHDVSVFEESHVFETQDEFFAWKEKIESHTRSRYSQQSAPRCFKLHVSMIYKCHRSGYYRPRGKGIRRLKCQGSDKMNAFCPASIKVKMENEGRCHVEYIPTHVGHALLSPNDGTTKKRSRKKAVIDISGKKDELIIRYMEALESITLPEQLEYMEQHFQPVNAALSDILEKHNSDETKPPYKWKKEPIDDENISEPEQIFATEIELD